MKTTTIEVPPNATEQVVRIQLDEVVKVVKQLRTGRKDRIRLTITSTPAQGQ